MCDVFRQRTGQRPSVDTRGAGRAHSRLLTADTATLYLDTSGEALFKTRLAAGNRKPRCGKTWPPAFCA